MEVILLMLIWNFNIREDSSDHFGRGLLDGRDDDRDDDIESD